MELEKDEQGVLDGVSLQWAAMYTGCEFALSPIRSGYCLLLTYELFHTVTSGALAGQISSHEAANLPLMRYLLDLLEGPTFMTRGQPSAVSLPEHTPDTDTG